LAQGKAADHYDSFQPQIVRLGYTSSVLFLDGAEDLTEIGENGVKSAILHFFGEKSALSIH
jgi:hypothetical protein